MEGAGGMQGFVGVLLMGVSGFVGTAIGRYDQRRSGGNDGASGRAQVVTILLAFLGAEIVRRAYPFWIAMIILLSGAAFCFGVVIREQRRLRSSSRKPGDR
jgi:hypothetical protein